MLSFIVGFILFFGCVLGLAICAKGFAHTKKSPARPALGKAGAAIAAVCAVLFLLVPMSIHTVDTGEVAVVKHLGDARNVRTAGTHFDFWLTDTYQIYDAKVQNVDIATNTYSSDAQTMDVQMTIQYQIMADRVIDIARQYGSLELLENRIRSISIEKTKAVLSSHKAMDIIANRAAMSPAVEKAIKAAIDENYFVDVTTVVITNIDFSNAFENAVEDKMIAEQKQLQAEYENRTKVAKAEADAEAKLIAARAEAEANRLLEESLTENILRQRYLEKWDGKLPETFAGQDVGVLLGSGGGE